MEVTQESTDVSYRRNQRQATADEQRTTATADALDSSIDQPSTEALALPAFERRRQAIEEDDSWATLPSGYQWPASRLTELNRRALVRLSNHLQRPMNQVLKEAVEYYAECMLGSSDADGGTPTSKQERNDRI